MGWTYNDLQRNRMTLDQAKEEHVRQATRYGEGTIARIIMHEWHAKTWYALIGFYPAAGNPAELQKPTKVFLRTDIIDTSAGQFGYKDMSEEMGPNLDDKPSRAMAKAVYKYIPHAAGYAKDFRDWAGISYQNENQLNLV